MKKYQVISLHFTDKCNLNCSFCYRKDKPISPKPFSFFIEMVPYMAKLADQVACGGGEPLLFPEFIKEFGEECKKHNLILNITTHGQLIPYVDKSVFDNVTMVSISYDSEKIKTELDRIRYWKNVALLKSYGVQVGMNLLVENDKMLERDFVPLVRYAFKKGGIDRVFALCKKNVEAPDILKYKAMYYTLTKEFEHFYVDDVTRQVIKENKLSNWESSCHHGKGLLSINESGVVVGCSFDKEGKILNKPEDILQEFKFEERYSCPYLVRK